MSNEPEDGKRFSKDGWPSTADPATDHVVERLDDGSMRTRDGYWLPGAPMPPIITKLILCFDLTDSCWNCDASLPENVIDGHYCSIECHDDAQERAERNRQHLACCDECGYDLQEHNPSCSKATEHDRLREGVR